MANPMSHVLSVLLGPAPDPSPITSLAEFRERFGRAAEGFAAPWDRALLAGFVADRVGYAFAGGYAAALACLVAGKLAPATAARVGSLCITEEGGGHPRAIQTTLSPRPEGGFVLTGRKRWATAAPFADVLLVAASTGKDAGGRNRLALVAVETKAPGVLLRKMPDPPFAPELPHAEVELSDVEVAASEVLPGDGYDTYVKPFRTIEDTHVFLALLGHLLRGGRLFGGPHDLLERTAATALALREIAPLDASAPATHMVLAGALDLGRALVERASEIWSRAPAEVAERWERDRPLVLVAERARAERRARAWERL